MCEKVEDSNMQNLHHFISNSPWDAGAVMKRVASDTDRLFKENKEKTGLLIDESGWRKQGKKSVGVARQYSGNLGKVGNGQVGVFASLVQGDKQNLYTDSELLYMQMQRYRIERSLQDAKSELGMAEYQVRTWTAWHHHISLTMSALGITDIIIYPLTDNLTAKLRKVSAKEREENFAELRASLCVTLR